MAAARVEFTPEAAKEVQAASDWYAERSTSAALNFIEAVSAAIDRILESPVRWPKSLARTRRLGLHRFPFVIFYRQRKTSVQILAVAHTSRKPGYWRERLK